MLKQIISLWGTKQNQFQDWKLRHFPKTETRDFQEFCEFIADNDIRKVILEPYYYASYTSSDSGLTCEQASAIAVREDGFQFGFLQHVATRDCQEMLGYSGIYNMDKKSVNDALESLEIRLRDTCLGIPIKTNPYRVQEESLQVEFSAA